MAIEKVGEVYRFVTGDNEVVWIGDPEESGFKPTVILNGHGGLSKLKVPFPLADSGNTSLADEVVTWDTATLALRFYEVQPFIADVNTPEGVKHPKYNDFGGLEFEIVLKERPPWDSVVFPIVTENIRFLPQPEYHPLHPTWRYDEQLTYCADFVPGSIAVYGTVKPSTTAGPGKIWHLWRPKAVDAEGTDQWCDFTLAKNSLALSVPTYYLEDAVYPVTIDPTFGKQTKGSGSGTRGTGYAYGSWYNNDQGDGTSATVSMYVEASHPSGDASMKAGIYSGGQSAQGTLVDDESAEATFGTAYDDWLDVSMDGASISDATDYWLCARADEDFVSYKDVDASGDGCYWKQNYNQGWPNDPSETYTNEEWSIHCDITAAPAGTHPGWQPSRGGWW